MPKLPHRSFFLALNCLRLSFYRGKISLYWDTLSKTGQSGIFFALIQCKRKEFLRYKRLNIFPLDSLTMSHCRIHLLSFLFSFSHRFGDDIPGMEGLGTGEQPKDLSGDVILGRPPFFLFWASRGS